jgi:hypothetical protein
VDGRRVLGGLLVVLGIASAIVGVLGLGDGGDVAAGGSSPSVSAEPAPSESPSTEPTDEPTDVAPDEPTEEPADEPTDAPSAEPSDEPEGPRAETPEAFFAALGEAFRSGDARFLFSRLHHAVVERYGAAQCRTALANTVVPDYAVEILDVAEEEASFVYETDGIRRRVHGATTVRVRVTQDGETFTETDTHIVLDGDRYRWLTDCGTPPQGAP